MSVGRADQQGWLTPRCTCGGDCHNKARWRSEIRQRVAVFEGGATCQHENVFCNGDTAHCEDCGRVGHRTGPIAELIDWRSP